MSDEKIPDGFIVKLLNIPWSAICLVAGTCIGGGMLALPVATGVSGFLPASCMMVVCWFAMTVASLFLLEVNLWMKEGTQVMTMAQRFFGSFGKWTSLALYLFISYASIVAYTAAGGSLFAQGIATFGYSLSKTAGCITFVAVFGAVLFCGHRLVGRVNAVLFLAMVGAYFALVGTAAPEINLPLFEHRLWPASILAVPLLLTTFSFQTMLPSLTIYLKRDVVLLRWAIVGGTTCALLIYLVWEAVVLGIVPLAGEQGLVAALEQGEPITSFLRRHVRSEGVAWIAEYFAFFALVTSFLGIALGLFDFLADSLKWRGAGKKNEIIMALVLLPTLFFAIHYERVFLLALDLSGGFGDAILNGMFPAAMVWLGRYRYRFPEEHRTPGGKILVGFVFLFFLSAVVLEVLLHGGWIPTLPEIARTLFS
jgi:tyrosine-specific transport protein